MRGEIYLKRVTTICRHVIRRGFINCSHHLAVLRELNEGRRGVAGYIARIYETINIFHFVWKKETSLEDTMWQN
jgi:hypothetical protein